MAASSWSGPARAIPIYSRCGPCAKTPGSIEVSRGRNTDVPMEPACGPLTRTRPRPPRPAGVATAAMVPSPGFTGFVDARVPAGFRLVLLAIVIAALVVVVVARPLVVAALSISGPSFRMSEQRLLSEIAPCVGAGAERLSRDLGYAS